ncbi:MAG: hypothetical protein MZW92_13490 [Comamonadaceae bacterium]|nr:hypothetical protein [Comamonadaceae bacterium]
MGSDKELGRLIRGEGETHGGSLSASERERWLQRQLDQEVAQRNMLERAARGGEPLPRHRRYRAGADLDGRFRRRPFLLQQDLARFHRPQCGCRVRLGLAQQRASG